MKRLALILGAVLLLGSTAHAGTKLPLNIVGSWCDPVDIKGVSYYRERDNNCKVDEGGDWMVVASNGNIRWFDASCRATNVAIVGKEQVTPLKHGYADYSPIYLVKYKCQGKGETWNASARMYWDRGGILVIKWWADKDITD
jgi:hypothetical protein